MSNEKTDVYQKYLNSLKEGDKVQAQFLHGFYCQKKGDVIELTITGTKETGRATLFAGKDINDTLHPICFIKSTGKCLRNILQIVVPVEFVNENL